MKKMIRVLPIVLLSMNIHAQQNFNLWIGTYTNSCKSDGIYGYELDAQTGVAKFRTATRQVVNPSFLTVAPGGVMYCVNEDGLNSAVSSFRIDSNNGKIGLLNQQNARGNDPCHIISDGKHVIAANYSGGNIAVFGTNADGSLTNARQIIQHQGRSVDADRQEKPHVHMVQFSPDKKFLLASDLGTDRLYIYNYNPKALAEILTLKDTIPTKTGAGPRHFAFSPNGLHIYLLHELDGTLTVFNYLNGTLRRIQEISIVASDFVGKISAADIHLSPDGRFLYATNRGDANTISVFAVDARGRLKAVQTVASGGNGPRNFAIDPGGNFLLAAHQCSNNIVVFRRDSATGKLERTPHQIELCSPVCVVFEKP